MLHKIDIVGLSNKYIFPSMQHITEWKLQSSLHNTGFLQLEKYHCIYVLQFIRKQIRESTFLQFFHPLW